VRFPESPDARKPGTPNVAKPKAPKQREQEPAKTRLYLTVDSALLKRFRHAAVELDVSESELFERLAAMHFGAVHARNVPENLRSATPDGGRAVGVDLEPTAPVVKISGITNRIGDIARRGSATHDQCLDNFVSE
jgi:hypothetical protein